MTQHRTVTPYSVFASEGHRDTTTRRVTYTPSPFLPGRGKTFVLRVLEAWVRSVAGRTAIASAFTGIAAADHDGGQTCHRAFQLPMDIEGLEALFAQSAMRSESARAAVLRAASLIVIDEVAMMNGVYVDVLDRLLRELHPEHADVQFGGKVIVFAGDFRQTAVVVPNGTRAQIVAASPNRAAAWQLDQQASLTVAHRHAGDPHFSSWLGTVGDGTAPHLDRDTGAPKPDQLAGVRAGGPHFIAVPATVTVFTDVGLFRDWVHSPAEIQQGTAEEAASRLLIAPHNSSNAAHNAHYLQLIPTPTWRLLATEELTNVGGGERTGETLLLSAEAMAALESMSSPDHVLDLKRGAIVLCMRNIPGDAQLQNGTRLKVEHARANVVKLTTLTVPQRAVWLPRTPFDIKMDGPGLIVRRMQFPLRLVYAATSYKAQGKTYTRVGVDLSRDMFSHGQLYVAVGRVPTADQLAVCVAPCRILQQAEGAPITLIVNVVYPEVLNTPQIMPDGSVVMPAAEPAVPAAAQDVDEEDGQAWDDDGQRIDPWDMGADDAEVDFAHSDDDL